MGRVGAVSAPTRPFRIAVSGGGEADEADVAAAEAVGRALAQAGAIVVCGGLDGVMCGAARGAAEAGGLTIGVLSGTSVDEANPWIRLPLPTGMGELRNAMVVRFAEAVVAVGGEWGTLSEIALARAMGIPVVVLRPTLARGLDVPVAETPEDAVAWALEAAERGRRGGGGGDGDAPTDASKERAPFRDGATPAGTGEATR